MARYSWSRDPLPYIGHGLDPEVCRPDVGREPTPLPILPILPIPTGPILPPIFQV